VNEIVRQRLVGALILLALGVIFWPVIFVSAPEPGLDPPAAAAPAVMPVEPTAASEDYFVEEDPNQSAQAYPMAAAMAPEPEPDQEPPAAVEPPAPAGEEPDIAATRSDASGWILQVASVSSPDKAETLRQRLAARNYTSAVSEVSSGGRVLYRVYLGPAADRESLERLRPGIDTEFGVTSMVKRAQP